MSILNNINIGYSIIGDRVYLGRVKEEKGKNYGMFTGIKKDITNKFISVMIFFIGEDSKRIIEVDGVEKYEVSCKKISRKKEGCK